MPYIPLERRPPLNPAVWALIRTVSVESKDMKTLAENLAYCIYKILVKFYSKQKWYYRSDVDKILNAVAKEFHDNHIRPYENGKKRVHGDV